MQYTTAISLYSPIKLFSHHSSILELEATQQQKTAGVIAKRKAHKTCSRTAAAPNSLIKYPFLLMRHLPPPPSTQRPPRLHQPRYHCLHPQQHHPPMLQQQLLPVSFSLPPLEWARNMGALAPPVLSAAPGGRICCGMEGNRSQLTEYHVDVVMYKKKRLFFFPILKIIYVCQDYARIK